MNSILTKRFRIIYDSNSKNIIFEGEFNEISTTYVGKGRSSSEFIVKNNLTKFIKEKNLTFQPNKIKSISEEV